MPLRDQRGGGLEGSIVVDGGRRGEREEQHQGCPGEQLTERAIHGCGGLGLGVNCGGNGGGKTWEVGEREGFRALVCR